MTLHPIRLTGPIIGVQQSFNYFQKMQDRVIHFIVNNSSISEANLRELMMKTGELAQDIGTIVIGKDAVNEGLIDAVGGLGDAWQNCGSSLTFMNKANQSITRRWTEMLWTIMPEDIVMVNSDKIKKSSGSNI